VGAVSNRRRAIAGALIFVLLGAAIVATGRKGGSREDRITRYPRVAGRDAEKLAARLQRRVREEIVGRVRGAENRAYARGGGARPAHRLAATFARALLRYETGTDRPPDRRTLKALATAPLAEQLSAPVRVGSDSRAPSERFVRIGALRPLGEQGFTATVVIERDQEPVVLTLAIVATASGLRVAAVG
jgi:hypothetical protein